MYKFKKVKLKNGMEKLLIEFEDKSHIYSLFDFEDRKEDFIIETNELRNLIDIWLKKLEE